jgi:hypothetical protein
MPTIKLLPAPALAALILPAAGQDWTQKLPDGQGKETIAAVCGACHEFMSRVGKGYTPEGWKTVIRMMINQGAPVPDDKVAEVTGYLAKNFPEKGKPAAAIIAGPVTISFRQWAVKTPGSRPHDPLAARDGSFWYTGQLANQIGHIDPKTDRPGSLFHQGDGPHRRCRKSRSGTKLAAMKWPIAFRSSHFFGEARVTSRFFLDAPFCTGRGDTRSERRKHVAHSHDGIGHPDRDGSSE